MWACTACLLACTASALRAVSAAKVVYEAGELRLQEPEEVGSVVLSPLPHTYLDPSDIPAEWNPHDIDGVTLVTSDLNQHIPQCKPCPAPSASNFPGPLAYVRRQMMSHK